MRAKIATTLLLTLPMPVLAESSDRQSVYEDTVLDSGYTAIGVTAAKAGKNIAPWAQASGAWHFDQHLSLGFVMQGLVDKVEVDLPDSPSLNVWMLGGLVETKLCDAGYFGATASLAAGWGEAGYRTTGPATADEKPTKTYARSSLFFSEPVLTGLFHASHRIDIGLGIGYRMVKDLDLEGVDVDAFRGAVGSLGLRGNF